MPYEASILLPCPVCGTEFRAKISRIRDGRDKHCSRACGNAARRGRVTPPIERLWRRVRRGGDDDCHPWIGHTSTEGYGEIRLPDGSRIYAHRLAWAATRGDIPEGQLVRHLCEGRYPIGDNAYRRCCNPRHLALGTHADNHADSVASGRIARGDRHGTRTMPERFVKRSSKRVF